MFLLVHEHPTGKRIVNTDRIEAVFPAGSGSQFVTALNDGTDKEVECFYVEESFDEIAQMLNCPARL